MLTAKEFKDKTERSYKGFLQSVLRREAFFLFHIKGNKGNANQPLQDLFPALKHLIDNSKEKLGYGYTVTFKEVHTRHSGIITMPNAIFFENPQDFLHFIDKEGETLFQALPYERGDLDNLFVPIADAVLQRLHQIPLSKSTLFKGCFFERRCSFVGI